MPTTNPIVAEHIANANAYLNNVGLPSYTETVATLSLLLEQATASGALPANSPTAQKARAVVLSVLPHLDV